MKKILCGILIGSCSGCATVVNGVHQGVGISTTPPGAHCKADDNKEFVSPKIVDLTRYHGHTVVCDLPGYQSVSGVVSRSVSGWLWGDLLFGGVLGLIVDFSTGGAGKLTPQNIELAMQPIQTVK